MRCLGPSILSVLRQLANIKTPATRRGVKALPIAVVYKAKQLIFVHFCSSNVNNHDTAEADVNMMSLNLSVIVPNPRHISSAADIDARHQDFLKLDPNTPEHSRVQRFSLRIFAYVFDDVFRGLSGARDERSDI